MKTINHHFSFLGQFSEKYADLKLSTPEEATTGMKRVVLVHKVVMAAVSEKIEALIDKSKDKDCVEVRNIDFLQKIVKFIYSGSVSVIEGDEEDDFLDGLDMLRIKVSDVKDTHSATSRSQQACSEQLAVPSQENLPKPVVNSRVNLSTFDRPGIVVDSMRKVVNIPRKKFTGMLDGLDEYYDFSMESLNASSESLRNVVGENAQNNNVAVSKGSGKESLLADNIIARAKSVSVNLSRIDVSHLNVASSEDVDEKYRFFNEMKTKVVEKSEYFKYFSNNLLAWNGKEEDLELLESFPRGFGVKNFVTPGGRKCANYITPDRVFKLRSLIAAVEFMKTCGAYSQEEIQAFELKVKSKSFWMHQ